jgi:ankyrin repeat protein
VAEDNLRCLTSSSDWIDEQNFGKLHKIVCGLLLLDLEKEVSQCIEQIDDCDAMGRTPLLWAAARGDARAVIILLSHGADPNIIDMYLAPPVSYAADRGHTECVRLLLEANADPDPKLPAGTKVGSPLNCAARNADDPLLLKYLLDFGADVEASGVDGKTSLIHAARTDNVTFAIMLLDYQADINAISVANNTPLTTAITYNSHKVLQLLLDRWEGYKECPRLKGPNLLQIVALYADIETAKILTDTDHLKLKYDKDYTVGNFVESLLDRSDITQELIQAFDNLLAVIRAEPPQKISSDSMMEKGISRTPSALAHLYEKATSSRAASEVGGGEDYRDDSDDGMVFEDTVEELDELDLNPEAAEKAADAAVCPAGLS